eukprot:m.84016 g.84016  ORF g.84016 m.84016 type:complete len:110 (+) comp12951_c0_seq1:1932-2261(+)
MRTGVQSDLQTHMVADTGLETALTEMVEEEEEEADVVDIAEGVETEDEEVGGASNLGDVEEDKSTHEQYRLSLSFGGYRVIYNLLQHFIESCWKYLFIVLGANFKSRKL